MIKEFINNCSKDVFEKLSKHVTTLKEQIELRSQHVGCQECGKEYDLPITMDQTNFFAQRS